MALEDPGLKELVGEELHAQLMEDVELLDGLMPPLDKTEVLAGRQTPLFFGSGINNFGVQLFLDRCVWGAVCVCVCVCVWMGVCVGGWVGRCGCVSLFLSMHLCVYIRPGPTVFCLQRAFRQNPSPFSPHPHNTLTPPNQSPPTASSPSRSGPARARAPPG
jgi:hypothetical protein